MSDEALVRQIVERLLADPEFQRHLAAKNGPVVKPPCLVLLNYVPELSLVLKDVQRAWGQDYSLSILPSASVPADKISLPEGMNWLGPDEACLRSDWAKIVLPACSANTLAKLALGIRDNALLEAAGRALGQGIPVELVTSYLGLTPRTPPAYRELYAGYLRQLAAYGVKVLPGIPEASPATAMTAATGTGSSSHPGVFEASSRQEPAGTMPPSRETVYFAKKLLADRDAAALPAGALVITNKTTVVSPLARDTLKTRRIELRQEREEEK